MSKKPWPKGTAGALSGGIIGPKPWQTTAKALKVKQVYNPAIIKVLISPHLCKVAQFT